MRRFPVVLGLLAIACSKPDPMAVCSKLVTAQVASNCTKEDAPQQGIWTASVERVHFDLVNVPGQKGQIASFEKEEHAKAVITALDALSAFGGKNHFAEGKMVIQMNSAAQAADVSAARAVLAGKTPDPVPHTVAASAAAPKASAPPMPTALEPMKTVKTVGPFKVLIVNATQTKDRTLVGIALKNEGDVEATVGSDFLKVSTVGGLQGDVDTEKTKCGEGVAPPKGKYACVGAFRKIPADSELMIRVEPPGQPAVWFRVKPEQK